MYKVHKKQTFTLSILSKIPKDSKNYIKCNNKRIVHKTVKGILVLVTKVMNTHVHRRKKRRKKT